MIKYRIKFENGRYEVQIKKWFFFWVDVGESVEGYKFSPTFGKYFNASQYIRRWHYDKFGTLEFRIEK